MRMSVRSVLAALVAVTVFSLTAMAGAQTVGDAVSTFTYTKNMKPQGYSPRVVPLTGAGSGIYNSDLAFSGKRAYQGTYSGFRIIDVSDPENPVELENYAECSPGTTQGNQGDVIVWGNLLVRSWNSPATATSSCDGELVGLGFEGLHVFDISNPSDPDLVGSVGLDGLPNLVTIHTGSAAGQYEAAGAAFGPAPTAAGLTGTVVLSNDGVGATTDACEPLVGIPRRLDRGGRPRHVRVRAQGAQCAERGRHGRHRRQQRPGHPRDDGRRPSWKPGHDPSCSGVAGGRRHHQVGLARFGHHQPQRRVRLRVAHRHRSPGPRK